MLEVIPILVDSPIEMPLPFGMFDALLFETRTVLQSETAIPSSKAVAVLLSMVKFPQLRTAIGTRALMLFWLMSRPEMLSSVIPSSAPPVFPTMLALLMYDPLIVHEPPCRLLLLPSKLSELSREIGRF